MPRVKSGVASRKRRKKILKLAKGYRGARSKLYRVAKEAVNRALQYAYRDRRTRKRDFRSLWILRINAAAKSNGISYGEFINGLKKAKVIIDRKILADLAVRDVSAFSHLAEIAKKSVMPDGGQEQDNQGQEQSGLPDARLPDGQGSQER